ncbi:MAG: TonB-dependent Receptor Plug Domain protein [Mucilaginibacter sp.]|nr:TonB-dependent Receptor Plug Domain protein [Mucilaginibacter sp.]
MRKNYSKKYVLLCAFLMMSVIAFAQTGGIKGKVIDETNLALPGASVSIDGTNLGATTDANGNYNITGLKPGNYSITAKFLGYIAFQKPVTVSNSVITVDFALKPQNTSLNEVVVIGYGTQKSKDLTGSIATVTAKDFNQGAVTTPEQLIQGKVAGVSIISNSGAPGSGSTIRIRGGASVNGSNAPLVILDGVPLAESKNPDGTVKISGISDPLSLINPNDIESFSILKDASAAAIYGNRASNGVIIITTKKGKSGKPVIDFSTQLSVSKLTKEAPVLSPSQYRTYINANDTTSDKRYVKLMGNANTDWQKEIYQTAISTDNNLSVSGTTGKLPYRVSVGYTDQNGILKTTSLQRYTGNINLSPSLFTDHLKINFNLKGVEAKQRFADEGGVIGSAVNFNPTVPVRSSDAAFAPYGGYWQWRDTSSKPSGLKGLAPRNPLAMLEQRDNRSTVYRTIASLAMDYKFHFFPDLHANVNLSYDGAKGTGRDVIQPDAATNYDVLQDGTYHSGSNSQYKSTNQNKLFEGFLSYFKDIKSIKSHVDLIAGYSWQDFKDVNFNYLSHFSDGTVINTSLFNYPYFINEYQLTSLYGRLNYNYDQKYYLTASLRSDVSTKFAPGIRTGNFPAVALAWKINNEDFLKGNTTVSTLKLRLEYGQTGNQEGINDYEYLSQYSLSTSTAQYQFGNNKYYQLYRPGGYYPGRTWERTNSSNAGVDFGFLNDRITGSVDYYYRKTKNLLVLIGQPAGTNFSNQIVGNVGDMTDQGVEFNITGKIIDQQSISWSAGFNVTYNKNNITNLTTIANPNYPGIQVGGISGGTGNFIQIDQPGYARNTFYDYQQVYGANGKPIDGVFVDQNGDGIINDKDRLHDHSPDPKAYFGLSSDFRYQKWSLGFVARASLGNYVYNNVASNTGVQRNFLNPIGIINNGSSSVLTSGLTGNSDKDVLSDYYVQNASFFRMDNIHLGYNFGKVFNGAGDLRMSANVQNVFIITQYKGVDPEISNGLDNNFYPRPRTYVLGLNLSVK